MDEALRLRRGSPSVAAVPRARAVEARPAGRQVVVRRRWAGRLGSALLLVAAALFGLLSRLSPLHFLCSVRAR